MKKTLKFGLGRRPQNISNFFSKHFFKLYAENQPHSLLNSGDGYEEDLKIRIWKITLT